MNIFIRHRRKTVCLAASLAALAVIFGCAGIKPYEPRDHREEGPQQGLFSGPEGEFVIFRKGEAPKMSSDNDKAADETEHTAPVDDTQ
jgi:hypothetical protein